MQSLTIPNFSSFDKFYEIDQKFKNETKELVDDQIALIKYITCLLSLKECNAPSCTLLLNQNILI